MKKEQKTARFGTKVSHYLSPGKVGLRFKGDNQLVELCSKGCDDAFEVIHTRYRQPLTAYAASMMGCPRSQVEDIVQEVFLRSYKSLRNGSHVETLKPWLYRIAQNLCKDARCRERSIPVAEVDDSRVLFGPAIPNEPATVLAKQEYLGGLVADINRLSDQQRTVLILRELHGFSHDEVADVLKINASASKMHLSRARANLVKSSNAREAACDGIRQQLLSAADSGSRTSEHVRRHLRICYSCKDYSSSLRKLDQQLKLLLPPVTGLGPLSLVSKLLGVGGGTSGGATAGAGLMSGLSTGKLATTAVCCAVFTAGGTVEIAREVTGKENSKTSQQTRAQVPRRVQVASSSKPDFVVKKAVLFRRSSPESKAEISHSDPVSAGSSVPKKGDLRQSSGSSESDKSYANSRGVKASATERTVTNFDSSRADRSSDKSSIDPRNMLPSGVASKESSNQSTSNQSTSNQSASDQLTSDQPASQVPAQPGPQITVRGPGKAPYSSRSIPAAVSIVGRRFKVGDALPRGTSIVTRRIPLPAKSLYRQEVSMTCPKTEVVKNFFITSEDRVNGRLESIKIKRGNNYFGNNRSELFAYNIPGELKADTYAVLGVVCSGPAMLDPDDRAKIEPAKVCLSSTFVYKQKDKRHIYGLLVKGQDFDLLQRDKKNGWAYGFAQGDTKSYGWVPLSALCGQEDQQISQSAKTDALGRRTVCVYREYLTREPNTFLIGLDPKVSLISTLPMRHLVQVIRYSGKYAYVFSFALRSGGWVKRAALCKGEVKGQRPWV